MNRRGHRGLFFLCALCVLCGEKFGMSANVFHFQRFSITQDRTAFKVGTDGILLGAWADDTAVSHALDIGTGTGLLALMLAQRCPEAKIDAVEIDASAAAQAAENVNRSQWSERVQVMNTAVQTFTRRTSQRYDLIVSNPPFFAAQAGLSARGQREGTRQTTMLTHEELIGCVDLLLAENGRFCTILPIAAAGAILKNAATHKLHCTRKTAVRSMPHKSPHRMLLQFERVAKPAQIDTLTIETAQHHVYTDEFIALTRQFYLSFVD